MIRAMTLMEQVKVHRDAILSAAARHGARHVRLFGSVARGDDDDRSDVDFLVEMETGRSLMDHAALVVELEVLLGRSVDVAPEESLHPRVRERVLREAITL
jgi:hypothetical protein